MSSTFNWHGLPHEMKLAVLEKLLINDVQACSLVDRQTHSVCLPILFRTIKLSTLEQLQGFLTAIPAHYHPFIHTLEICTMSLLDELQTHDAFSPSSSPTVSVSAILASLLSNCSSLESLSLNVGGSLVPKAILPVFRDLDCLRKLKLENWEREEIRPFSERLAVSLAFALPRLEELSLTRITRSAIYAPELRWTSTGVPLVEGDDRDEDFYDYKCALPLDLELRLPQLLRLPHLRRLKIRDTHLGDPAWASEDGSTVIAPLEVLDLGACAYVSPRENEMHTARILARMPPTITAFALSSSLPGPPPLSIPVSPLAEKTASPDSSFSKDSITPSTVTLPVLPHLRTLHLTPLVPTDALASTLSQPALAGSPVHTLSCSFHPDDAAEGCAALEAFLRERGAYTKGHGRKRSSSKLITCETLTEEPEEEVNESSLLTSSKNDGEIVKSGSIKPRPRAHTIPTPLYPSLRTVAIEIPAPVISPVSPAGKISPRRLAAARRREDERRDAARRLKAMAKELGLDIIVQGVSGLDIEESVGTQTLQSSRTSEKVGVRSRANTTF